MKEREKRDKGKTKKFKCLVYPEGIVLSNIEFDTNILDNITVQEGVRETKIDEE